MPEWPRLSFVIAAYLLAPRLHSWVRRELVILFAVLAIIACRPVAHRVECPLGFRYHRRLGARHLLRYRLDIAGEVSGNAGHAESRATLTLTLTFL
jgi:hypothetical protein